MITKRRASTGPRWSSPIATGGRPHSWERGQSFSVFAIVIMTALIITAGLVIDGGQKVHAVSRAQSVAAAAARAGAEAGATRAVAGRPDAGAAYAAADAYLRASPGVSGDASVQNGVVTVHTRAVTDTLFLSLIGFDQLTGSGEASAELVGSGG